MSKKVILCCAALVAAVAVPFYLEGFWLQAGLFAMSAAIGAIGINLLTGATGQLSMGHAFFLAVGAYSYVYFAAEPEGGAHGLGGLGLPAPWRRCSRCSPRAWPAGCSAPSRGA